MNFCTKVDLPATDFIIDYNSRLAFFGSCFADNISAQFAERKFHVLVNPFGTVYNPVSLASQIKAIADGKVFKEEDVFQDTRCDRLWHCWDAHSSLSGATKEECVEKLNTSTAQARDFLQKASAIFITIGTAFVYYLKDSGKPVSNCHRQDPALFERRMISVEEAAQALKSIVRSLKKIKQDQIATPTVRDDDTKFHVIFTVSPLRHMSDGAHSNNLSKATLQLAIHNALEKSVAEYFPSYEIVMDELRDYRFYSDDMVHLSKTAEEYIFERMVDTYCSEKTRADIARVEKFMKMANHRIQDENSPATQEFKEKLAKQAAELEKGITGLKLD